MDMCGRGGRGEGKGVGITRLQAVELSVRWKDE